VLPGFDYHIYEERCEETNIWTNQESRNIITRMLRLKKAEIEKSDYYCIAPPKYKDDPDKLFNIWKNRFIKYSIDTQLALYDQTFLEIDDEEAIDLVLYNELLRYIILRIPKDEFSEEDNSIRDINEQIDHFRDGLARNNNTGNRVSVVYHHYQHQLKIWQDLKYEWIFSSNETVEQRASRIYHKIRKHEQPYHVYECTSIADKETVLRQYLRKQTPIVSKSKNSRGQGFQKAKKEAIIQYISNHPKATNVEVAQATGTHRDTVRKYRKIAC
jgi:hypothetical protein